MTDVKQSKSEEIDPDDLAEAEIDSGPEDTIKEPVEALEEQVSELKDQLLPIAYSLSRILRFLLL